VKHQWINEAERGSIMRSRYARLSLADWSNLRIERAEIPAHIAALCLVEAAPLLDAKGELDLPMIRRRLERRLARVPTLRRVVYPAPPLCGPALWVDDAHFSIARHVNVEGVAPPGDEASLLATAERLLRPQLDRSHPLWELWLLTGLADGRIGLLFKFHHAIADGLAAVALLMAFFDLTPDAPDPPAEVWTPALPPADPMLFADNLSGWLAAAGSTLAHPLRLAHASGSTFKDSLVFFNSRHAAPRTSLNALPGVESKFRVAHLDLEIARTIAHAHGAKVNDVVLAVVAGGVRELLLTRGERLDGVELATSVPAALRNAQSARELGNAAGALLVRLPAGEADAVRRLERIAANTRIAKAEQHPAYISGLLSWLAATRLALPLMRRQRFVNFFVTNVPGPSVTLYVLGARIEDVSPILGLAGNVTIMFAALSYCGRLNVLVSADAAACPDVDILATGMRRAWDELTQAVTPATPVAETASESALAATSPPSRQE
jgi:diacylglycerol O-acyltransferase / wax synthase